MPLRQRVFRIGQSPFCDLTFQDSGLARIQLEIIEDSDSHKLLDKSGLGTKVNGKSIGEGNLVPGDLIDIGEVRLLYRTVRMNREPAGKGETVPLQDARPAAPQGILRWKEDGRRRESVITGPILIGKNVEAHLCIADEYASNSHCLLLPSESGVVLRDLGSTNGTWIKDLRIFEVVLPAQCTFLVGKTEFHFECDTPSRGASAPMPFMGMIGRHASLLAVQALLQRIAPLRETVLVLGETGTGKELTARAIHTLSGRDTHPFVAVNCGAIAHELIESELFGHEKGAFTGAGARRAGAFESAGEGTLFLDEVGELPLALQPKLLRALDDGEFKPVGSDKARRHRARVVAATNRDLRGMVAQGKFREDLYYRLSVLPIRLPPLRERREDVPLLAQHFLSEAGLKLSLTPAAIESLMYYYWPGNVRELRNVLVGSVCYHPEVLNTGLIDEDHLLLEGPGGTLKTGANPGVTYKDRTLDEVEAQLIREALTQFGGNKRMASRSLGISKSTLYEKLKRYSIEDA